MSLTGEKGREGLLIKGKDLHLLPKDADLPPYRPSVSGFGSDQNIHSTGNVDRRPMHNSIWDKSLQNQLPFFVWCHSKTVIKTVLAKTLLLHSRSFKHLVHTLQSGLPLWQFLWTQPCDNNSWCSEQNLLALVLLFSGWDASSLAYIVFRIGIGLQVRIQKTIILKLS